MFGSRPKSKHKGRRCSSEIRTICSVVSLLVPECHILLVPIPLGSPHYVSLPSVQDTSRYITSAIILARLSFGIDHQSKSQHQSSKEERKGCTFSTRAKEIETCQSCPSVRPTATRTIRTINQQPEMSRHQVDADGFPLLPQPVSSGNTIRLVSGQNQVQLASPEASGLTDTSRVKFHRHATG